MDDLLEMTMLYDFYGELLTKKQRSMFELYYMENHSLGEIAKNQGVSRQAVFDGLKKVKAKLFDWEKKVGYMAFYEKFKKLAAEVQEDPAVSAKLKNAVNKMFL